MIDRIELRGVNPEVFAGEPAGRSDVWRVPTLVFSKPESYMVEAESGTGKSSLVSFIYGARTDYKGEILFNGEDIRRFDINRWCALRREALACLPQEMKLFPELTVMENIQLKNRLTGFRTEAQITGMLAELGLEDKINSPAALLSIGQQQRVAIIRALCQPFDFLLADEPVSHLDARNNTAVASMIQREAKARGASIIATSVGNQLALPQFTLLHL